MAELVIAQSLLVYRFKARRHFLLRLFLALAALVGLSAVAGFLLPDNAFVDLATYMVLFAATLFAVWFCFDERLLTVLFYCVAGYTVQHIASELFTFCALAMRFDSHATGSSAVTGPELFKLFSSSSNAVVANPMTLIVYFFVYGVTYFFGYYFVKLRAYGRGGYKITMASAKVLMFSAVVLFFDVFVSLFVAEYGTSDFNRVYQMIISGFNLVCCAFVFVFQFFIEGRDRLADELKFTEKMYREKTAQYDMTKENIALINQKCHDLKHQVRLVGSRGSLDENVVEEIEQLISIYDAPVRTGNEALDIILTEKSLLCNDKGIKLCCIIDGKQLDFITPADTYALFGNMLDNAIEAVSALEEKFRTINLSVTSKKSFVVVNTYNYFAVRPEFDGKFPVTTKSDKTMHGYGIRSMQMICNKYGGELSVGTEGDQFVLNILFPRN